MERTIISFSVMGMWRRWIPGSCLVRRTARQCGTGITNLTTSFGSASISATNLRTRSQIGFILVYVLLAVIGCGEKQPSSALSLGQATDLALKLANDEAEAQYKCRPFTNGPPAQLVEGRWIWQDRQAQGLGDVEASVRFESNGVAPNVRVLFLDSRSVPAFRLR